MTFTYANTLLTDRDKIRFKVGDTVENSGIRPGTGSATNFTDEEIAGLLTLEGSVNLTVTAIYESLASAWAIYVDTKIGPRDEKSSQAAKQYAALAKQMRDQYGYGSSSRVTIATSFVTRHDAYSNDVDASETESL